jgi:hypothetical protein
VVLRNAHQQGWGCIRRSRRLCKTSDGNGFTFK